MNLLSNDQRQLLNNTINKYFSEDYDFDSRQSLANSDLGYSAHHWSCFAEFGWLSIPFSESLGGLGGTTVDLAHLTRAMGSSLAVEPLLSTVVLAGQLIANGTNESVKDRVISEIISGESIAALAFEEPQSNGNFTNVKVAAVAEGQQIRITGEKISVLNAPQTRYIIVSVRMSGKAMDGDGIGLVLIDTELVELNMTEYKTVDGHQAANIQFDTLIGTEYVIAGSNRAMALLTNAVTQAILLTSAEAIGIMQYLLDTTTQYVTERKQFGVPLTSFQVLRHKLADMMIALHSAESLLEDLLHQFSLEGALSQENCSILKVKIGSAGRLIADTAIQLHGGMGMTDELKVGHGAKRLLVIDAIFGNADFHLRQIWRCTS